MKQRILFILISVLFIFGMLGHHFSNRTFVFGQDYWTVDLGERQEDRYVSDDGQEGRMLTTTYYSLNKGDYMVTINYSASAPGSSLVVEAYERDFATAELPVSSELTRLQIPISLERDSTDFRLHVEKAAAGAVAVEALQVGRDQPLNNDYAYLAVMMTLGAAVLYYLLFCNKGKIAQETVVAIVVLTAAAFMISAPYLRPNVFRGDDLSYHAYKIEGIKDGLLQGQFPVYVYPYTLKGYGYLQALYPSLLIYPASILRMFGVTIEVCFKSLMFAMNLGTGWMTYVTAKKLFRKHKFAPLLTALLYMAGLYRVGCSMWIRSAFGEVAAMMFLPLVILGLYELLAGNRKKWWYLAIAYSALLQCHMLSCIMVALFSVVVSLFYVDGFFREKRWIELLKVFGCVLAFNAWYLVPFVLYYTKANLDLDRVMYDGGLWRRNILYVTELFQIHTGGGLQTNSLGMAGLICTVLGMIGMLTQKNKDSRQMYLAVLMACSIIFALLITNLVPWELLKQSDIIDRMTEMIQFPYRFLVIVHVCLVFAGVGWLYESNLLKKYVPQISCMLLLASLMTIQIVLTAYSSERGMYAPGTPLVAAVREYLIKGTDLGDLNRQVYVSDETKVHIIDYTLDGNQAEVRLLCQQEGQYVEAPIFNYPGYGAFNEQGRRLPVAAGSNNRVRVNLPTSPDEQVITVRFVGKKIFWVGYGITLAAVFGAVGYVNRERLRRFRKPERKPSENPCIKLSRRGHRKRKV